MSLQRVASTKSPMKSTIFPNAVNNFFRWMGGFIMMGTSIYLGKKDDLLLWIDEFITKRTSIYFDEIDNFILIE